jgi:hypothetical protein
MYCGAVNPMHHLLMFGTKEGRVEAWDPRSKKCVSKLDCAMNCAEHVKYILFKISIDGVSKFCFEFQPGQPLSVGYVLEVQRRFEFWSRNSLWSRAVVRHALFETPDGQGPHVRTSDQVSRLPFWAKFRSFVRLVRAQNLELRYCT